MTSVNCNHDKCIYNNRGECTLSYVNLNAMGTCMDCRLMLEEKDY